MAVGLAFALVRGAPAALENYCPGSPWNCMFYQFCRDLYWCGPPGPGMPYCSIWDDNYIHNKYLILKRCQNGSQTVYCTACGPDNIPPDCCSLLMTEPSCPDRTTCP